MAGRAVLRTLLGTLISTGSSCRLTNMSLVSASAPIYICWKRLRFLLPAPYIAIGFLLFVQMEIVMFINLMKIHIKCMFRRAQTKIAFIAALCLCCVGFIESCLHFSNADLGALPSAAYGWQWNMDSMQISSARLLAFILIFFIASSAYADEMLKEVREGTSTCIVSKASMHEYVITHAISSYVSGFIVIAIPLAISQCLAFVVFPLEGNFQGSFNTPVYLEDHQYGGWLSQAVSLDPYLINLAYIGYASTCAGVAALFSFSLTFHLKQRLLALMTPSVAVLIVFELMPLVGMNSELYPAYYLYPSSYSSFGMLYALAFPCFVAAISILIIWGNVRFNRSVLL